MAAVPGSDQAQKGERPALHAGCRPAVPAGAGAPGPEGTRAVQDASQGPLCTKTVVPGPSPASQSTSLTSQIPTSGLSSSTLGMTAILSSSVTNLTTGQSSSSVPPTTVFLPGSTLSRGSSSFHTVASSSSRGTPVSSLASSPTRSPGICSVKELQEEVTYKGCTANVTVTRCEGFCPSSASFNVHTEQVDVHCGCCYPLSSYEKQLVLPCPDPGAQGQRLVLTLQMFSSCACRPRRCGD
uniref:mucin-6-like n=1 Tax=Panthera onca TaxID=9690 RepID=UPI0029547FBD|nr:mucin-6-like [Panthera onca]